VRVRGIQVELEKFEPAGSELDLFDPEPDGGIYGVADICARNATAQARRALMHLKIQDALDRVHAKYGMSALVPAASHMFGGVSC